MKIIKEYYNNGNIKKIKYVNDNNQLHNKNGPSIIRYYINGDKYRIAYYINDKLHRENGPALIDYDKQNNIIKELYYLNGIKMNDLQTLILKGTQLFSEIKVIS